MNNPKVKQKIVNGKGYSVCEICNKSFRQLGNHIYQNHNMSAREYKIQFGLDLKKSLLPDDLYLLKKEQVFENKTVNNLKKGNVNWFESGDKTVGKYKRSQQSLERLKKHGYLLGKTYNKGRKNQNILQD